MTGDTLDTDELRAAVAVLEDERLRVVMEQAIDYQEEHADSDRWQEYDHTGFEVADIGGTGWEVPKLRQAGLIEQVYDSNNSSYYRIPDMEFAQQAVTMADPDQVSDDEAETMDDIEVDELFTDIVGRETAKKWMRRTIENDADVHHLMYGAPGGGKSMILEDVLKLPNSMRVVLSGNQSSAAGITQEVARSQPDYLVVEEIEKGSKKDREALMTLCGEGYVQQTKGDGRSGKKIEPGTTVFAAANDLDAISPESLVDRFMTWPFEAYDHDEFRDVCEVILPRDYGADEDLALYIADRVFEVLDSTRPRDAESIAELAETEDEVDELVTAMQGDLDFT